MIKLRVSYKVVTNNIYNVSHVSPRVQSEIEVTEIIQKV